MRQRVTGSPRWLKGALPAAAAAALLALAACSTTGGSAPPKEVRKVTPIAVDAGRAARMISAYRAEHGLGRVRVDPRLMKVAADYARVMGERDTIKHGLGRSLPRRTEAAGYDWGYVSENLAASYDSVDDAMRGWKASKRHNKNLLNQYSTDIGIAAVSTPPGSAHRNYWALVLGLVQPENLVARTADGSATR